ncbi:hypothetical protein EV356DRAFT_244110 [Viridothelium virens]|uniref:Uncharacterized protein n=1 Tax=Viridothelium virens TaxID=1048519 RepID=A0A6A6H3S0_VIRVR|nr:hypothetical protein EV356DRAFT_244110 [Viridothelium virens]
MAGRFISGLLPTQWLQPQYSRLPGSHNSNFSRPPYTGRSVFTILVLVLEAVLIALTCWWAFPRIHNTLDYWQNAPTSNGGKALVIASFKKQDVSWIDRIPSSWDIYRYFLDDPHPLNNLSVPRNNGRESMAYLTYIIDHYDNLPDYVIFTHGHERSWHQIEPLPLKIRALNLTALEHENYISLRCENQMGCERIPYLDNQDPNWAGENHLAEFWDSIMPDVEFPRYIAYKCCGQHAVTKKAIMAHTKEDWIRIRSPLLRDLEDIQENEIWGSKPTADEWILGMFYEKIWHVLFGMGGE